MFSTLHLELRHEYSVSLCNCNWIDIPFTSRYLGRPLQIVRVHIEFVYIAENYTESKQTSEIQTVGKREVRLGVAAANPLRGVNILGAPQIGTLGVDVSIRQHRQLHLVNQRSSAMNVFLHGSYFPFSRRWRRNGV